MATHSAELLYNATRDPHKVVSGASAPAAAEWCPGRELHSGEGALRRGPGQMVVVSISPQAVASIAPRQTKYPLQRSLPISAPTRAAACPSSGSRAWPVNATSCALAAGGGPAGWLPARHWRCQGAIPGLRGAARCSRGWLEPLSLPGCPARGACSAGGAAHSRPSCAGDEFCELWSAGETRGAGLGPPVPGGGRCWQASVRAL